MQGVTLRGAWDVLCAEHLGAFLLWILVSYVGATYIYYCVLARPDVQTYWVVAVTSMYPVVTVLVSALVLGQVPSLRHWAGIVSIVLGGILLCAK